MNATPNQGDHPEPGFANVVRVVDGEATSQRFRWAPGAEKSPIKPPPEQVNSYADATLRIVWVCRLYATAAGWAPDTAERRGLLEAAHFAMPTRDLRRIARERNELGLIAPIAQQIDERARAVGAHLASLDSPVERFPFVGGLATRLILLLQETVNLLQPYVLDEREPQAPRVTTWDYVNESSRRVRWAPKADGFVSMRAVSAILVNHELASTSRVPTLAELGKRLDAIGNPVRHMKRRDKGAGRHNRQVLASDVERYAAYLFGVQKVAPN